MALPIRYLCGIALELLNCSLAGDYDPDAVNFVARTSQNNGVVANDDPDKGTDFLTYAHHFTGNALPDCRRHEEAGSFNSPGEYKAAGQNASGAPGRSPRTRKSRDPRTQKHEGRRQT